MFSSKVNLLSHSSALKYFKIGHQEPYIDQYIEHNNIERVQRA